MFCMLGQSRSAVCSFLPLLHHRLMSHLISKYSRCYHWVKVLNKPAMHEKCKFQAPHQSWEAFTHQTFLIVWTSVNSAFYISVATVTDLELYQTKQSWNLMSLKLSDVFWFLFLNKSASFTGAGSWPRGLTCALSTWSTQRAGTVSCSASRKTRLRRWRPSRRAAGWNWSARYEGAQN